MLNDLLMDVDTLDFVKDDESCKVNKQASTIRDPISGAIIVPIADGKFPRSNGDAPLIYKFGKETDSGMLHEKSKTDTKLYPVELPKKDNNAAYITYINNLYGIYSGLGNHKVFSRPTIGVISSSYDREHAEVLNLALESQITELEFLIESYDKTVDANKERILDLEQSLVILYCLQAFQFIRSGNDREKFFKSLLSWVNRSDGEPTIDFIESVFENDNDTPSYNSSAFWKLLNQLLLRGLHEQAINTLKKSKLEEYLGDMCDVSFNAYQDLMTLLNGYPMGSEESFKEWKAAALELQSNYVEAEVSLSGELRDYFEDTLSLLAGNQSRILQYSSLWYEAVAGFLLYYIPSTHLVQEYLALSVHKHPIDVTSPWEKSCVDIIENNIFPILPTLESLDSCTASFTAALCEAFGLLVDRYAIFDEYQHKEIVDEPNADIFSQRNGMASFLLNNFALELCSMEVKSVWPVAIGLISLSPYNSPSSIKSCIGELLPHYPFETNDDIEWALTVCARWKLPEVAKEIYTTIGNQMLNTGNTVEAIANFSRASRYDWVKKYSWLIFENSAFEGKQIEDDVLNRIVENIQNSSELISDEILSSVVTDAMRQSLAPYAVLSEFFKKWNKGDNEGALGSLVSLIDFTYLPKQYLVLLITKYLYPKFLADNKILVKEDTVLLIIEALENKWDDNDEESVKVYQKLISDDTTCKDLPSDLLSMQRLVRKMLNYKLCQNLM
ncbi:Nucleoporin NUP85 [Nakaseomyces bracarensis]|uniref:Nuclear pore complex protein Nup85 n=1 Tax=Nakaseomyces bracarensis TaxID=273131 RepID=A0ABR4NUD0_9SACH